MSEAPHFLESASTQALLTLELSPPRGTNVAPLLAKANKLKGLVDAINVPDCQRALLRMSSLVVAALLEAQGIPTVWQLTCRDRNLIALQADLLGGYAIGLRTVLALTGDPVQVGDQHSVAQNVFNTEAVAMLKLLQQLKAGNDATAKPLTHGGTPAFVTGAAINPAALARPAQRKRLCHKLETGATFFQSQPVYSAAQVRHLWETMAWACQQVGCPLPTVLLGLVPPKHAQAARFFNQVVPGMSIPESWITHLEQEEQAGNDPTVLSLHLCAELVASLPWQAGQGFHLMPVRLEKHAEAFARQVRLAARGC